MVRVVQHVRATERRLRTARLNAKVLKSRHHPILAQHVPSRLCIPVLPIGGHEHRFPHPWGLCETRIRNS